MLARWLMLFLFLSGSAFAQIAAIRAGNLIDPATGTVSRNQIILVKDGKIAEVGPRVEIPQGADVIDLSNSWVMPGLMDAHSHLSMNLPRADWFEAHPGYYLTESTALRALLGLRNGRIVLQAGFTTVRDAGNEANYAMSDLRRAIQRGWFVGPSILNAGKIIAAFGGQSFQVAPEQPMIWQFEYIDADTPDDVRKAVRQNIFYGARVIKLVFGRRFSEEEVRAAVEEAHRVGIKVAVHAGFEAARKPILAGADSIEHGDGLSDELLLLMKERGTVLVPRAMPYEHWVAAGVRDPKVNAEDSLSVLRRAHRIGVKMVFGADVVYDLPDKTRADMVLDYIEAWAAAGIPPADILKALTSNAAELLGIQNERGTVKPGLVADIIASPENPLEKIQALRQVHFVMKDGQVVKRAQVPGGE